VNRISTLVTKPNHWVSAYGPHDRCAACGIEVYNPTKRTGIQITGRCDGVPGVIVRQHWVCASCVPEAIRAAVKPVQAAGHVGFCDQCRRFMGDACWVVKPEPKPPIELPTPSIESVDRAFRLGMGVTLLLAFAAGVGVALAAMGLLR